MPRARIAKYFGAGEVRSLVIAVNHRFSFLPALSFICSLELKPPQLYGGEQLCDEMLRLGHPLNCLCHMRKIPCSGGQAEDDYARIIYDIESARPH